tara:strand:+ start:1128 stop:1421 length:294 start_codon:yes stop_codon:yes gene_type:complete
MMIKENLDKWKRESISTNAVTGQTIVDGKEVGRKLWIGSVVKHFTKEEDVIIRAADEKEFVERIDEMMQTEARQRGYEPGLLAVNFCMPKSEFDAKG